MKADKHCIPAFNSIMTRLAARRLLVDLNIRENEASADFKQVITETWKTKFQLVLPDMHRRNKAKQMIRHFKNHFLSILAGADAVFPPYLWDLLLPQAKSTVNLLHQATINQKISTWEYFIGPFEFNKTPLAPQGLQSSYPLQTRDAPILGLQSKARLLHWPCIGPLQML
jgi:hypothetical protein